MEPRSPAGGWPNLSTTARFSQEGRSESRGSNHSAPEVRSTLEDRYHVQDPHLHYPPKQRSWHARPRSPGLKWYKHYTAANLKKGRVLVVDYIKHDPRQATRKVAAQEIEDVEGLRKLYHNPSRREDAMLRVFHVQNADWATQFLLRKFNINARNDLVGTDFARFVECKRPRRHGGKPSLTAKSYKTVHDPWRKLSISAFGMDYLKPYRARDPAAQANPDTSDKVMELNWYDQDDVPVYGYDVYAQRVSCYIQHQELSSDIPIDPDIPSPYENDHTHRGPNAYFPQLDSLDNCNTIIIFENSQFGSIEDTMIPARRRIEARWRRLPFYLAWESQDIASDEEMALMCAKLVIQDVWKSLAGSWDTFLDVASHHVGILEDKIYAEPADESRQNELIINGSMFLTVERLMFVHKTIIKELQANLREIADNSPEDWLESSPGDFEKLNNLVQEDLVKPINNLSDLMYKSVGIRDSRHSLHMSMSMYLVSIITFVFLPLTFIVGVFGTNVDTFANNPSIMWLFISAVPLMVVVLASWFILKHSIQRSRQTPYSRGIYEQLFYQLATAHPLLWSRTGPRPYIVPQGRLQRWKWWLIVYWSAPEKTIRTENTEDQFDGLGGWSRLKRQLIQRWTAQMKLVPAESVEEEAKTEAGPVIATGVERFNEMVIPAIQVPFNLNQRVASISGSPRKSESPARPSSQGSSAGRNSGVMVEEERPDWLGSPPGT